MCEKINGFMKKVWAILVKIYKWITGFGVNKYIHFIAGIVITAAVAGSTVSEFHATMFCAGTQKLSTILGTYNLAEAITNDMFFIDPNGTVTKWNPNQLASNIIKSAIRSYIEELPCIKARS